MQALSTIRSNSAGIGERLSRGGGGALGFAIGGTSDPEIWSKLTPDQQMWVSNTLNTLNTKIIATGSAPCPTWGPAINLAGGCFQAWFNNAYGPARVSKLLRIDGVFDEDTLCALQMIAGLHPADFPHPFPDPSKQYCKAPVPVSETKKLSTGAMVGIAAAGAAAVGGVIWLATKKK